MARKSLKQNLSILRWTVWRWIPKSFGLVYLDQSGQRSDFWRSELWEIRTEDWKSTKLLGQEKKPANIIGLVLVKLNIFNSFYGGLSSKPPFSRTVVPDSNCHAASRPDQQHLGPDQRSICSNILNRQKQKKQQIPIPRCSSWDFCQVCTKEWYF